jgi:hypothetical protein
MKSVQVVTLTVVILLALPFYAAAQERLCDTQFEDCRAPLLTLINNETQGIDVALWFIQDDLYATALINRFKAGVPVRILVDQRASTSKTLNQYEIERMRDAGIPMRDKYQADILHYKMMLFDGQNVVEFSKANYSPESFVPTQTNANYFDEAIFFTNDSRLTNTFRRRFEDLWTDTTNFRTFGNITGPLVRRYPLYPLDPSMNFVPLEDFSDRAVSRYNQEVQGIDAIVFRVTDHRQADAMINAVARGVPVRLISEPSEYRNPGRLYDSKHIDRMYMGGVQIKMRQHEGLTHEASVVLHGLGEVIFGSSNWTTAAAGYEDDHNYFYNPALGKPWFFQWFFDQFNKKWSDTTNYVPFKPLPPDKPVYSAPGNGVSGISSSVTLTWDGGTWSHLYDIYFGTSSTPPLVGRDLELGSPDAGVLETFTVSNLAAGTTYYWRIVDKTWAQQTASGNTWSFTTAGTGSGGGGTPASTPYGGTAAAIPGTIQAENFDEGGSNLAYYDTTAGNKGGAYRSTDVDIGPTNDAGGGYYIGWTPAGEWLKYTVNVTTTGTYTLQTRVANVGTGASFHVEVDGVNKTGSIAVPNTGSWTTWQTISTPGISLSAGTHVLRVSLDTIGSGGAVGGFNWFQFVAGTSTAPPPTTTPYGGTAVALPGTIQAENFDQGGQSVAYYDTTAGNKGGAYRITDVDIGSTNDVGGGYYIGWTPAGEWLKYTVNVTTTGTYSLQTRVANLGTGASFHVEVDGVDKTGRISVPNTGAWDAWQTITTSGISLSAGTHVLRVSLDTIGTGGAVGGFNWFKFVSGTTTTASAAFGGTPAIPGTFEAENFDNGGQSIAYFDTTAGNKGGAYRDTDVDIGATNDIGGGYYVGWTRAGEWLNYTVNVATPGTYSLEARVADVGTGASFHVEVDGVDKTGRVPVPDTGAWDAWQTISKSGISLSAGQHLVHVSLDTTGTGGAVGGFNWFRLSSGA